METKITKLVAVEMNAARPQSVTGGQRSIFGPWTVEAWATEKDIANVKFIHFPTILEYRKKNSEIHPVVLVSFMSDLVKEIKARLQDFGEIDKFSIL